MSVALRPVWFPAWTEPQRTEPQRTEEGKSKIQNSKSKIANQGTDAPRSPVLSVYIATRRDITLYHDDNGDLTHIDATHVFFVLKGTVEIETGGEKHILTRHCSIALTGTERRRMTNVGSEPAELLTIQSPAQA